MPYQSCILCTTCMHRDADKSTFSLQSPQARQGFDRNPNISRTLCKRESSSLLDAANVDSAASGPSKMVKLSHPGQSDTPVTAAISMAHAFKPVASNPGSSVPTVDTVALCASSKLIEQITPTQRTLMMAFLDRETLPMANGLVHQLAPQQGAQAQLQGRLLDGPQAAATLQAAPSTETLPDLAIKEEGLEGCEDQLVGTTSFGNTATAANATPGKVAAKGAAKKPKAAAVASASPADEQPTGSAWKRDKEKNRQAQQRFRVKQKLLIVGLKEEVETLHKEVRPGWMIAGHQLA